jgi:ribonuclease D
MDDLTNLRRPLSREEINALPIRRYEGEVRVIAHAHEAAPAMADILQETLVGFDTETRPAFRAGESYPPSLAQVATARAVYLFVLREKSLAEAVAQMLSEERIVKAGVALSDDLKALKKLLEFTEKSVVDLGRAAARSGFKQTGVRSLAAALLGFRIPKGTKTSNWARSKLTEQQIVYAATDAWACREIYLRFQSLSLFPDFSTK